MKKGKTTTLYARHEELIEQLRSWHTQRTPTGVPRWVFLANLRVNTGFGKLNGALLGYGVQTLDAWAMDTWPSGGYKMVAYEVKASRSDFFRELEHPEKRQAALDVSTHFYFVVPSGLISPQEVPEEAGLLYVTERQIREIKRAPKRPHPIPRWEFIVSVARNLYRDSVQEATGIIEGNYPLTSDPDSGRPVAIRNDETGRRVPCHADVLLELANPGR